VSAGSAPLERSRSARLRSPLLLALGVLLAFEAAGGLWLFVAFLTAGRRPGESLHTLAGGPLAALYAIYQWRHWRRVRPFRARLDFVLGLVAATVMALALLSGLALGGWWWSARLAARAAGEVGYPPLLSALHNIGSMLVLAFVGAHLGAVLMRDRPRP
jgi:hypothetical protein